MKKCVGAVVIGRNEGERLRVCLRSLVDRVEVLVYVDSGSTDHSLKIAESFGVGVVNLDVDMPFTAARARNEGLFALIKVNPDLMYVQFIDGDCEVVDSWLDQAVQMLSDDERLAIVCGRRKERYPEKSVYNRLCDIEWDTPVGEANACGGDALIRISALLQVGGYDPSLIAGEEPEMCLRLLREGFKIERIDADMTWHDADMTHFSQWWKRAMRSGHADAEGAWLHGDSPERYSVRAVRRNWIFGGVVPALILMAIVWPAMSLFMFIYPLQIWRIYHHSYLYRSSADRRLFALFCVLSYLPVMFGQLKFHLNRIAGVKSRIIEYK